MTQLTELMGRLLDQLDTALSLWEARIHLERERVQVEQAREARLQMTRGIAREEPDLTWNRDQGLRRTDLDDTPELDGVPRK